MKIQAIGRASRTAGKALRNLVLATILTSGFGGLLPAVAHADGGNLNSPLGTVLKNDPGTLPADLQSIATGRRIVYVSSDVNDERVRASALIITPDVHPTHANTVTWSHALSGVADQCAPSNDPTDYFYPEAVAAVKAYLQQGWTVAAPDYAGLGSGSHYEALVGSTEARSVIDSVRAARNLDPTLTTSWVASGHSGGGSSPIFAGEIAGSYGSGLSLKGIISMAPLSNVDSILPFLAGTPANGYFPVILYGIGQVDSNFQWRSYLAQPARNLLPILQNGCVFDILGAYQDLTADQLLVGGQLPDAVLNKIAHYDNPGQARSDAPILLLQGTDDQEVPADLTEALQSEECAQGSTSFLQLLDGVGHDDLPIVTTSTQVQYINDRFNGVSAPSNC